MFYLRCLALFGHGEDGLLLLGVLIFDLYFVTLNPGVVSCYNPLEKVLVFPGFIRQFLTLKHAAVSLRRWATETQTSWPSTESSSFPLKFAEGSTSNLPAISKTVLCGLRWRLCEISARYFFCVACGRKTWMLTSWTEVPAYPKGENYSQVRFVPMAFSPESGLSISCGSNVVFRSLTQCFIPENQLVLLKRW